MCRKTEEDVSKLIDNARMSMEVAEACKNITNINLFQHGINVAFIAAQIALHMNLAEENVMEIV